MTIPDDTSQPNLIFRNDEPSALDKLGRAKYAKALSKVALHCETPMAIGLFGGWGIGKSSLMLQIKKQIERTGKNNALTIWFNPWLHQFDQNPGLSLIHCMCSELNLESQVKDLLKVIGCAFGSAFLKRSFNINFSDIQNIKRAIEDEDFLVRDVHTRLRQYFKEIIKKAKAKRKNEDTRIVFFIDDLDRCDPNIVLTLLEYLKLYFNVNGCIYFLGVDKSFLKKSISLRYKETEDIDPSLYLDKIIQLPFDIPPIAKESIKPYIEDLISPSLKSCVNLLATGVGDNPRQVKRFINTLQLNHILAQGIGIEKYSPKILAFFILVQYMSHQLYLDILKTSDNNNFLDRLTTIIDNFENQNVKNIFLTLDQSSLKHAKDYIHLTKLTGIDIMDGFVSEYPNSKIRIKDITKKLRISNKDMLKILRKLKIKVKSQMGVLTEEEAYQATTYYTQYGIPTEDDINSQ